ncbi:MAG: hypothetical protein A2Z16_04495 [Chloroflexi bacterium RBG_16_54_18]|nr:MAG: hypothetical protein A2Z16_04495 [Chloroflexi bacterium RBG_16_54_18]
MTEDKQPLRVLIFGAGAIGIYLGCSLHHSGSAVAFVEKQPVVVELRKRGLHLSLPGQELAVRDPQIVESVEQALEIGTFDVSIFALKSFDTGPALQSLLPFKDRLPPILCLQNGVDNEGLLAAELGAENVIAGTVTSSILRRSAGNVVLERKRGIGVAATHPIAAGLCEHMDRAGLNARLFDRPLDMKWSKLIINLLGNASSAILDMPPTQVYADPGLFHLEVSQIEEALAVMQAQKIRVVNLPATPVRLLSLIIRRFPLWLSKPLIQRSLGAGRGRKMPSLHMDLQSGRKYSEVEDLNGAVVRYGRKLGIPTPTNQLLYQTLLQLVNDEIPWSTFRKQPQALLARWNR